MSVSATTRNPRPGEIDGMDYHFLDMVTFGEMRNRDAFLEYARVFDHYYGTPREPVEDALQQGRDVLFDIDWQGTQQLQEAAAEDLVKVFILPPSAAELEISHYPEYDYIIVNHDLDDSLARLNAILVAERLKRGRQTGLSDFVKTLRQSL